jgi:hypothetical protein
MHAGQMDVQVAFYSISNATQDSYGRPVRSRVPFEYAAGSPSVAQTYWAQVEDVLPSRQESTTEGIVIGRRQSRIRLRYVAGLDSSMEVDVYRDDGIIESHKIIGGPSIIGRRDYIEFLTEQISS